ncbi:MAG: enoyl-CoA hydratase/isomerase family protein [Burkholderiaceae bacterium]
MKEMPERPVRLERTDRLVRLIIDNPRRRNALSRAMWREIAMLITSTLKIEPISALVVQSSTAGCFCAGADIAEFADNYASVSTTEIVNQEIHAAISALENCPFPTLALIDGPCVGGGLALALACDIRLASDNARFALTPSRLGLSFHPEDVSRLLNACSAGNASELLFGAQSWTAARALQAGLVNDVRPSQAFEQNAGQLIDAICENSSQANRVLKQTLRAVQSQESVSMQVSTSRFTDLFSGPDFIAGRTAFLNKTPVSFPSNQPEQNRQANKPGDH